jgi:hypothetical protein
MGLDIFVRSISEGRSIRAAFFLNRVFAIPEEAGLSGLIRGL